VGHVLATQCLLQRKPMTMRISFDGALRNGVTAKDMALAMIATIGASGGTGYVLEFDGPAIESLSMEGRMTLCNMSIEAGARAGMVAPDEITFAFLKGRQHAPKGAAWDAAVADWKSLRTEPGAKFDKQVRIDASKIQPMVTFGTSPDYGIAVNQNVPVPHGQADTDSLKYMKLEAGAPIQNAKVNRVFVGSCTNSRMSDLRAAADILRGRKVAPGVVMLVVPGSESIRIQAEAEGLHTVFEEAGAQWRLPGCSMCIAMNGDKGEPGELVVSTSNRNFMGRQGKDVRTVLASPATAAASAVAGHIADPRDYAPVQEKKNVA
jgi:3-isopropylmalate/(R)-2-methylmalate dehydratase large subunit